jgi:predicted permease
VKGRDFADGDAAGAPRVAIVNERFVQRFWPGQDPIGRTITQGGAPMTIVGVAKQGKYNSLTEDPVSYVFVPALQEARAGVTLFARTTGDPKALTSGLRAAFQSVSPDLPFLDVRTMEEHMQAAVFAQRLGAIMLAAFGLVALLLSAIGIYGVLSFGVRQRTREIGVRVALGADRRDVVQLVIGRAVRLAGLGLVIGVVAALGAGQLLRSQLIGVGPRDPLTFISIALLLGLVAILASWLPARRASRVDPMVALRAN